MPPPSKRGIAPLTPVLIHHPQNLAQQLAKALKSGAGSRKGEAKKAADQQE